MMDQIPSQAVDSESEQGMNLDTVSDKHLHELEQLTQELLLVMRRAKLLQEPLAKSLRLLQSQTEQTRCKRFDKADQEFQGY